MSNQDNPYGGTTGAGNYQMSNQSENAKQAQPGGPLNVAPGNRDVAGGANMAPGGTDTVVIQDISTTQFATEVIDASNSMPVLIDFWAPWCEPCKQLTPMLEKLAGEFSGQMKLVKMNTEEHPEVAGQMGVQSIPTVVAFVGGKPVDAFTGVKPESEIRAFIEKHAGPPKGVDPEMILAQARDLARQKDFSGAINLLAAFLQTDPQNPGALGLLGSIYLKNDDVEQAEDIFNSIDPQEHGKPDVAALKAELELTRQSADLGELDQLVAAVEADPKDLQAKFDLSLAYNVAGNREQAGDLLLEIIKTSREWNEDGARKQLIKYFEAWGEVDEATKWGRRKLSTVLFS